MSWGDNGPMRRVNPQGVPQITINLPGLFSYRESGRASNGRCAPQGMDAQVPPLTDVPSTTIGVPTTSGSTLSGGSVARCRRNGSGGRVQCGCSI